MRTVVAATRNPAKVAQLQRLVDDLARVTPLPRDILQEHSREELDSFEANAVAKAVGASRSLDAGTLVVATDGGLLIPALVGTWDPMRTRRFAGDAADDQARGHALLALCAGLRGEERRIGWREALAVAQRDRLLGCWTAEGTPGVLAEDFKPEMVVAGAGFWLPALWICPELGGRRLAELTEAERAGRADHWARLGSQLRRFLAERE